MREIETVLQDTTVKVEFYKPHIALFCAANGALAIEFSFYQINALLCMVFQRTETKFIAAILFYVQKVFYFWLE